MQGQWTRSYHTKLYAWFNNLKQQQQQQLFAVFFKFWEGADRSDVEKHIAIIYFSPWQRRWLSILMVRFV